MKLFACCPREVFRTESDRGATPRTRPPSATTVVVAPLLLACWPRGVFRTFVVAPLLLLLALSACVARSGPGLRPDEPAHPAVSDDIDWGHESIEGAGKLPLFVQHWRPRAAPPRAVLVIHHGLADHSDRYSGLAQRLARAGYAVWALDMRGHGRSAGPRVVAARIDNFLDDLGALFARVAEREPSLPIYLFGHSIGGLISSLYTVERGHGPVPVAGLIVSAPGLAFEAPPLGPAVIRLIGAIAPGAAILDTPHEDFSASREVIDDMNRDPLISQGKGPAITARSAVDGNHRVWSQLARLDEPLLALHGSGDKVVAAIASRDLVAGAASTDKTLRLYDGLNHDLLHEPDGGAERIGDDIQAWLDAHSGVGTPAPTSSPLPDHLRGDRGASATSIELDVRGERPTGDDTGLETAISGGVRLRLSRGAATPLRLGWHGGLDLRGGGEGGARFDADAYLLGVAVRLGRGGELAVSGGIGAGRAYGETAARIPVEASLDVPLGPVRVLARATAAANFDDDEGEIAGVADQIGGFLGVRIGRDLRYWADVVAGTGPFVGVSVRHQGGEDIVGVALGIDLWGAE